MSFNPEYTEQTLTPEEVAKLRGSVLLEFGAPWCAVCLAASPMIEKAMQGVVKLQHIKIHDSRGKKLGRHFGVKLWPTLIVLKDGEELNRLVRPEDSNAVERLLLSVS